MVEKLDSSDIILSLYLEKEVSSVPCVARSPFTYSLQLPYDRITLMPNLQMKLGSWNLSDVPRVTWLFRGREQTRIQVRLNCKSLIYPPRHVTNL